MYQQLEIGWKSKNGIGFLLVLWGWSLIFQIIPTIHVFQVIGFGFEFKDFVVVISLFLSTSIILMSLIAATLDNLYETNQILTRGFRKATTWILFLGLMYEIGYLLAMPVIFVLDPVVSVPLISSIKTNPLVSFVISLLSGLAFAFVIEGITELLPESFKLK